MPPLPPAEQLTPHLLRAWSLPVPDDEADKHARGTVLVVGGAVSTPGAILLAGLAALRVGAGRLQIATVSETAVALGVSVPEAMVVGYRSDGSGSLSADCAGEVDVEGLAGLLVGPGLLGQAGALELLTALLPRVGDIPLVLDAVALTVLTPELLAGRSVPAVLTPNGGELKALIGEDGTAEQAAARYGAVVATHGVVVSPDGRTWGDEAGSIGLGTSGSGDVQAGAVVGLLARGAAPEQAAAWGQYLHAAAGDRLVSRRGRVGFLARELLDELPAVLMTLTA